MVSAAHSILWTVLLNYLYSGTEVGSNSRLYACILIHKRFFILNIFCLLSYFYLFITNNYDNKM